MSMPTAAELTNIFLTGQSDVPDDVTSVDLLRPEEYFTSILLERQDYMDAGAGRFALGSEFSIVKAFFDASTSLSFLVPGVYSKSYIMSLSGLGDTLVQHQFSLSDGVDDYAERVYMYNSTAYVLSDDVEFVVGPGGDREIREFSVRPRGDDFDFDSNSLAAILGNPFIESRIDPWGIGRKVKLVFSGDLDERVYSYQDYLDDISTSSAWEVAPITHLYQDIDELVDSFVSDGVIPYTDDGVPVVYGSLSDDEIYTGDTRDKPELEDISDEGAVVVSGAGMDTIVVDYSPSGSIFKIYAGEDYDIVDLRSIEYGVVVGGVGDIQLFEVEELKGTHFDDLIHFDEHFESVEGGSGEDTLTFAQVTTELSMVISIQEGVVQLHNIGGAGSGLDLSHVESIVLTDSADTIVLEDLPGLAETLHLDGGEQGGGTDILDLGGLEAGVSVFNGAIIRDGLGSTLANVLGVAGAITYSDFEALAGTSYNDVIYTQDQFDEILLGGGDDIVLNVGAGTRIWGGEGADTFYLIDNVLIEDASAEDRISYMGLDLSGGIRWAGSDSAYAMHESRIVGYGLNDEGQLVIHDFLRGRDMYVANYVGGPGAPYQTAGIYVAEMSIGAYRIGEVPNGIPGQMSLLDAFLGPWMKAHFGTTWDGADPLVLDLDGDGLELTGRSYASPVFDIDGDGYGEHTGWVSGGDGFLVLDANDDGQISDVAEMFGGAGQSGFDELATHDVNTDGVIDASDAVFADLSVWRDDNRNMQVDEGELLSLDALDITSISLATTTPSTTSQYNNTIGAQGTFVRDGISHDLYDVTFQVDNRRTEFLGDNTISSAAAALPKLKGYGTLTDLQVAMTLDPALQGVVGTAAAAMTSLDLADLRAAAMPALLAWAEASPLAGGPGTLQPHDDVHLLTEEVNGEPKVTDFAYFSTTDNCWKLASGRLVHDGLGAPILSPSLIDVLADDQDGGTWDVLDGDLLSFLERYTGEVLPLDSEPLDPEGSTAQLAAVLDGLWQNINLLALRLAFQGGLSGYFPGLEYDLEGDKFVPTTDRELIPTFEAIFTEVEAMSTGRLERLAAWEPILDLLVSDYDRGDGVLNSYGFLFSNIVAAYESVGLSEAIDAVAGALGIPEDLVVFGGSTLAGSADADLIYLSAGAQTATGGDGPDTFVVGGGFGHDVIDELEATGHHSEDVVRFADTASTEVTAARDGIDLVITVTATGDELRIKDHFDGRLPGLGGGGDLSDDTGVDLVIFADGVTWTPFDVARAVARNTSGNDVITGTDTVDWLDGGAGDDLLSGGEDADAYVYGRGYGDDVIDDDNGHIELAGPDVVVFGEDIAIGDLHFTRDGDSDDLQIEIDGETGSLTILNQFAATYTGPLGKVWIDNVEALSFDDGSSLSWQDITNILIDQASTAGNDVIHGFSLEDTLEGGAGNDFLSGGNEDDTYLFGFGDGHDTIEERLDNILSGGDDTIRFDEGVGLGDVVFSRGTGLEDLRITLSDGATIDILGQFEATDAGPFGMRWFDRIETFAFAGGASVAWDDLFALVLSQESTSGDDELIGFDWDDVIDGGAGNDFLSGGNGDDGYVFGLGYGHDTISDAMTNILSGSLDYVVFNADIAPQDIIIERGADIQDLEIYIDGASDRLTIDDTFAGHAQIGAFGEISEFRFSGGTTWTIADIRDRLLDEAKTAGADVIDGFVSDDVLDGGAGDDLLRGRDGADTYLFGRGYDEDVIDDNNWTTWSATDVLRFGTGIALADLVLSRDGDDLTIQLKDGGVLGDDQVTIVGQFDRWIGDYIEEIRFDDAPLTVLGWHDVLALYIDQAQTAGDDLVLGAQSDDEFEGGTGADRIEGGDGDDTYAFNLGDGADVIFDCNGNVNYSSLDKIVFGAGIDAEQIEFSRVGDDLFMDLDNGGDSITVEDYFVLAQYRVEELHFANSTVWRRSDIMGRIGTYPAEIHGTSASEAINGTAVGEALIGHGGDDTLTGDEGNDTYVYTSGDGSDTIRDYSNWTSETDKLLFTDLNSADVTLTRVASGYPDVQVKVNATGEVITIRYQYYPSQPAWGLEQIEFANGTVWNRADILQNAWIRGTSANNSLYGTAASDVFWGGLGDDYLEGGASSDTYVYASGDGDDTINDAPTGDTDVLKFTDLNAADLTFTRGGSVLTYFLVTVNATGETITVRDQFYLTGRGVSVIAFADGSTWDREDMLSAAWIRGTSGADTIFATVDDETIVGGAGNDTLNGDYGSDTYIYRAGDGSDSISDYGQSTETNILKFTDLNASDFTFSRDGSSYMHLLAKVNATGEIITVKQQFYPLNDPDGVDQIVFANGAVWDREDMLSAAWIRGSSSGEYIFAGGGDDTILGGAGNDTLYGQGGSDTFVYRLGDGSDTITDYPAVGTTNTLKFTDLNPSELTFTKVGSNSNLQVTVNATGETVTVNGQFYPVSAPEGLDQIVFANATVWDRADIGEAAWIRGTSGANTLTGTAAGEGIDGGGGADTLSGAGGDDRLLGGVGNDSLTGGDGSDIFTFHSGFGVDVIQDFDQTEDDLIEFDSTIFSDFNDLLGSAAQTGSDVLITASVGDTVLVKNVVLAQLSASDFHFV